MTRVLINEFDTIVGLGICEVLREGGCEVIMRRGAITPELIETLEPDAMVVDMDDRDSVACVKQLQAHFPGIPYVECSSAEARIRVFPAYRFGESYEAPLSIDLLVHAVTTV
ncbi:MAG: hypothetical protein AB8G26_12710 [Ilumatobacter sp.]